MGGRQQAWGPRNTAEATASAGVPAAAAAPLPDPRPHGGGDAFLTTALRSNVLYGGATYRGLDRNPTLNSAMPFGNTFASSIRNQGWRACSQSADSIASGVAANRSSWLSNSSGLLVRRCS